MPNFINILDEIAGKESEGQGTGTRSKFQTSIITTYSAYLPFYENVVLRRLLASGCRYNVLLVDAHNLAQSLQDPTQMPRLAGRSYVLAPMVAKGAFHPKIAMLLGEHHARILVGSHNTTFSGFGYNRELSTRVDIGKGFKGEHRAFFQEAWKTIETWTNFQKGHVPQKLIDAIHRIGTDKGRWLQGNDEQKGDTVFLSSLPDGESLWDKALPYLPKSPRQIIVLGPFFDRAGSFLQKLQGDLSPGRIVIGLDTESQSITLCRQDGLPENVSFHNGAELTSQHDKSRISKPGYLHAKALFFDSPGGNAVLITGSANPSSPAWIGDSGKRNAEAVVLQRGRKAKELAEELGLLKISQMPLLDRAHLEELYTKNKNIPARSVSNSSTRTLVAETVDRGLLIPGKSFSPSDISTCLVFFENQSTSEPKSISEQTDGLFIEVDGNPASVTKIIFKLSDGKKFNLFVHCPTTVSKLRTTSRQQTFHDALYSLGGDSPDFAALFRVTERLIFDEAEHDPKEVKAKEIKIPSVGIEISSAPKSSPLGPLSIPLEQTYHHQRKRRELHHGDQAFVIDALIHHLGSGLHNATNDMVENFSLSEEEQTGKDDEQDHNHDKITDKENLLKICNNRVHTLAIRMCTRLNQVPKETTEYIKCIDQLFAILAVIREVRANDFKLGFSNNKKTLVPLNDRKKLLDSIIKNLFGDQKNIYDKIFNIFKNDPDTDLPKLLGLIIWLAWDSGLDIQDIQRIPKYERETLQEALLENSKLFVIAYRAGKFPDAFAEANRSAWRTCREDAQQEMSRWMQRYEKWAQKLSKLLQSTPPLPSPPKPEPGQLAITTRGSASRPRIILEVQGDNVLLAEPGRDSQRALFTSSAVQIISMPAF